MPTKIFVGNIALETSRELLMPLFQRYGQVTECDVLGSYGFVHMANEDEAKRAIAELNGCSLNGNRLNVEMSTANTQGKKKAVARLGTTKIFVGNIRDGTTSEQLRTLFQAYGRVTEADVLSGFGFVHMDNEQEARNAIRALNSQILNGSRINVEMSTNPTPSKSRDRDARNTVRPTAGPRYDSFPTTVSAVPVPRRSEQYIYDSYAGAAAAGTAHATGSAAFVTSVTSAPAQVAVANEAFRMQAVAPQSIVSEPYRLQAVPPQTIVSEPYRGQSASVQAIVSEPFRLQSAAPQSIVTETFRLQTGAPQSLVSEPYRLQTTPAQSEPYRQPTIVSEQYAPQATYAPRISAGNDVFTRELLELYATNPTAFSLCAQNPATLRSMNPNGQQVVVGMTDMPGNSYGLLQAQGDYFDKRINPRYADVNLAQAQAYDMFAPTVAGPMHDPVSAATRGYPAMHVAAPAGGMTFVPAPSSVMRGNQQSHIYRLF